MNHSEVPNQASPGVGVGLRSCHYDWVLEHRPPVGFFEVISENFMAPGGKPLWYLEQTRKHYPIALHGVSLSLGSADPTPREYLRKLADLIDRVAPFSVSDHLCWAGVHGNFGHDLWPLPYTEETIAHVVDKIDRVQNFLKRRILIENLSTYIEFKHSELTEWEFLSTVAARADCGILLDLNNIFVTAHNHGINAFDYIDSIPMDRVSELHLAGPSERGNMLIDTHDHPVTDRCWELYEYFLRTKGPRTTLLEWDDKIPPFPELLAEAGKAEQRLLRRGGETLWPSTSEQLRISSGA